MSLIVYICALAIGTQVLFLFMVHAQSFAWLMLDLSCLFFPFSVNWDWIIKFACFFSLGSIISIKKRPLSIKINKWLCMYTQYIHSPSQRYIKFILFCVYFNVCQLASFISPFKMYFLYDCYRVINRWFKKNHVDLVNYNKLYFAENI